MILRKVLLLLLLLPIWWSSTAQLSLTIFDSLSGETVPYAHVLGTGNEIVGVTDRNGLIWIDLNGKSEFSGTIQHVSYTSKAVRISVTDAQVLLLPVTLGEVVVSSSETVPDKKKAEQFIVLNGYFRSYQLEDNKAKYYSDGFVNYYFPANGGGEKLAPVEVLEHRTFQDLKMLEEEKSRAFNMKQESFGPPFLRDSPRIKSVSNAFDIQLQDAELKAWILDEEDSIGEIVSKPTLNMASLDVDINYSERLKVKKMFGYRSIFERHIFSELYGPRAVQLMDNGYDNMNRVSEYRKLRFKHKSEKAYRTVEWYHEFYVIDRYYLDKEEKDMNALREYRDVKYASSYSSTFVQQVDSLGLEELPDAVLHKLDDGLVLATKEAECPQCQE